MGTPYSGINAAGTVLSPLSTTRENLKIFEVNAREYVPTSILGTEIDAQPYLQQAVNRLPPGGGCVIIPRGTYTLARALVLPTGCTIRGDGDSSCVRPALTWGNVSDDPNELNRGLFNAKNKNQITIEGLRFDGRMEDYDTQPAITDYPKLIFTTGTFDYCKIAHCWLENSLYEGAFSAGNYLTFIGNHIKNCGMADSAKLTGAQLNGNGSLYVGNTFEGCGIGLGIIGYSACLATGNTFRNNIMAIGIGDAGITIQEGPMIVSGNVIQFASISGASTYGIYSQGNANASPKYATQISNNCITAIQASGHTLPQLIYDYRSARSHINGNTLVIDGAGIGIRRTSDGSFDTGAAKPTTVQNNDITLVNRRTGTTSYGLSMNAIDSPNTLALRGGGNTYTGFTNDDYAADYRGLTSGVIAINVMGDFITDAGIIRIENGGSSSSSTAYAGLFFNIINNTLGGI